MAGEQQQPQQVQSLSQQREEQPSVVLQQMPGEPTDEQVARAFAMYDPEGTTYVATAQLGDLMRDLGMPLSEGQLQQALMQLDPLQAGRVSFGEFLMWWKG